jgi:hypothetical protein
MRNFSCKMYYKEDMKNILKVTLIANVLCRILTAKCTTLKTMKTLLKITFIANVLCGVLMQYCILLTIFTLQ